MASLSYWNYKDMLAGNDTAGEDKPGKSYEPSTTGTTSTPTTIQPSPQETAQSQTQSTTATPAKKVETDWTAPATTYQKKDYSAGQPTIETGTFDAPQVGDWYKNLFKPVEQKTTEARGKYGQATSAFTEQAGPVRTYESIGGQKQLEDIVSGKYENDDARQTAIDQAKQLVTSQYTGPSKLDQQLLQDVQTTVSGLREETPLYSKPTGTSYLLGEAVRGLSPGQVKFETQRLMKSPEYLQAAKGYESEVEDLYQDILRGQQEAADIAAIRQSTEEEIGQKALEYLTGRQTGISDELAAEVAKLNEEEAARQAAYDKFSDTGSLEDLIAAESLIEGQPGYEKAVPTAEEVQQRKQQLYTDIWSRPQYAEISTIPEMVPNPKGQGAELTFPTDWWNEHKNDYGKKQWEQIKALARERQKELSNIESVVSTEAPSAKQLQTEARTMAETLPTEIQAVLDKPEYASIATVLPLKAETIDDHGRARLGVQYQKPDGTWAVQQLEKVKTLTKEQKQLLQARQKELEALGIGDIYDPARKYQKDYSTEEVKAALKDNDIDQISERDIAPLYFGELGKSPVETAYKPQDIRPYAQYVPSMSPSRENISTENQREIFNLISDVLDKADKIVEQDPYEGAKLVLGIDQYIADEEKQLGDIHEELDENRQDWLKMVKKARRKVRDAKNGISGVLKGLGQEWVLPLLQAGVTTGLVPAHIGLPLSVAMKALT